MALSQSPVSTGGDGGAAPGVAGHGGNWLANVLSGPAFLFSGASFYTSALQQADLEVFLPPVLNYGRDDGGEINVFAIPITIAKNGVNTGTLLAFEVTAEALSGSAKPKKFYSAFIGEHPRNPDTPNKTLAPISVPGRATYSEPIRFYPQDEPLPKRVTVAGDYRFTLAVSIAEPAEPSLIDRLFRVRGPSQLQFDRTLPFISVQHLAFRRGTIAMHDKDRKPTASGAK
jgi:hypothetical protein